MRELCEKAKQGDAKAFAELYAQYAQKLYATAFYLLGRKEDAEDIVMDTVADAFAQIRSLRNADAFGGWIFRMLRRGYIGLHDARSRGYQRIRDFRGFEGGSGVRLCRVGFF